MNIRPYSLCLILIIFTVSQTRAGDTTSPKKPWYISVGGGYTSSRAGGSLVKMVDEFNQQFGIKKMIQKDGGGFEINVGLQKRFSDQAYFKTGLGYIQKKVNPEENSYPLYKDSLKTGYLSLPFLFGVDVPLNRSKTIALFFDAGPYVNFKIIDKTTHGQDRAGFKTFPVVVGARGSAGVSFVVSPSVKLQLQYTYSADITNTYNETLYWGGTNEPYRTRSYKYMTHSFSLGFQWPL
jgi:opacity protein-like surface antigen